MSLDDDYANGAYIKGGDAYYPRWQRQSQAFREAMGPRAQLGLAYGTGPRQAMDLFLPDTAPKGVLVFVHGGYWIEGHRDLWSHLAAGATARGWACALPSYTLAPAAHIRDMTAEIAAAVALAGQRIRGPVVVTGHSAGGHLAARMGCADIAANVVRVVPISPLSDLAPLMQTSMNADLRLDEAECAAESPARLHLRSGTGAHIWVGTQERPAFLWHARLLSERWGCPWTPEAGRHHFDIIDGLSDPMSPLMRACLDGLG
ncbi:alpha/beta hydrolase [Paragemmobacter straminiformis]|uniref:Alpha/beta hydrolase n=1 Tax=Paragemmobacter straminiformis TaxID=2045119 RepID=A0A842I389_9RHOB|nr:alpha/beta hydrolase [Gemmobacter straminiformis]MBC2834186.1 alpha/beta hydrolase [Gemmobacter straminiformis]